MHYVDTSALIAYFVPEVHSVKTEAVLRDSRRYPLAISEWAKTEFMSALGIKCRTGQLTEDQSLAVQQKLEELSWHFTLLPVESLDFRQAADWLKNWRLGLRAGDALHLAVSHRHGYTVLSLDDRLVQAANFLGIAAELI